MYCDRGGSHVGSGCVDAAVLHREHGMEVPQETNHTITDAQPMVGPGVECDVILDRRSPDDEVQLPRIVTHRPAPEKSFQDCSTVTLIGNAS